VRARIELLIYGNSNYIEFMNDVKPKRRKKIYLVNRDFQLRYTYSAVIVGLISTALTTVVILSPLFIFKILRIPNFLPTPVLVAMAVAAFINIILVALMGVIMTHKIAGPMYSLVREFRRIEAGLWNVKMRLRQDDDLKFVVRNFNEMVSAIVQASEADLSTIEQLLEGEQDAGRRAKLEQLRDAHYARLGKAKETSN